MKIIITEKVHEAGIKLIEKHVQADIKYGIKREELLNCIKEYDAMIIRADTPIDKELMDAGCNLKAIGMAGIGLNHVDVEYAKKKGIGVYNVADGSNDSVAELTIALMLNIVRKVSAASYATRNQKWDKHGFPGNQLKGKTMGIIALGKIGSRVAGFCQAFGMKVIAYDPFLDPKIAEQMNIELLELDELLKRVDIISIHAPLTKGTYHLIGRKEIEIMKPCSFILNLGRGGVVDEEALYEALKSGHLAGAAVDVMEKEPPGESKLFELDNFIATPHIGAGTVEAQEHIALSIVTKVLDHLQVI